MEKINIVFSDEDIYKVYEKVKNEYIDVATFPLADDLDERGKAGEVYLHCKNLIRDKGLQASDGGRACAFITDEYGEIGAAYEIKNLLSDKGHEITYYDGNYLRSEFDIVAVESAISCDNSISPAMVATGVGYGALDAGFITWMVSVLKKMNAIKDGTFDGNVCDIVDAMYEQKLLSFPIIMTIGCSLVVVTMLGIIVVKAAKRKKLKRKLKHKVEL